MTRRVPHLLLMLLAFGRFCTAADAAPARPNVVFILADDLGWTDLACYGSKFYETPNIDRMAARGMRFTQGYTCGPNCQPTRAALLSGQLNPRTGVYTVGGINRFDWSKRPLVPVENSQNLPLEKITLAEAFKKAGYATGMFGKWHLGDSAHYPTAQGFDEAVVNKGDHFQINTSPPANVPPEMYLADFLTDKAVEFLDKHKQGPFFLYLPHFVVHSPHQAKEEMIVRFREKQGRGGHEDPVYAGMIASLDESVGRVLAKLDELELSEKTLVIFSSDNGGVGGYEAAGVPTKGITNNAPLRGGKGMLYEGGIRVPYIFYWPGVISPATVCKEPIYSVDLYPTLLEVIGAKPEAGYPLDGKSYLACLTSGGRATLNRDAMYWHFPGYLGAGKGGWRTTPVGVIRSGRYKLMEFFEDGHLELYDLDSDIGEKHDLAKERPDLAKQLYEKLVEWRKTIGAKMPERVEPGVAGRSPVEKRARGRRAKGRI